MSVREPNRNWSELEEWGCSYWTPEFWSESFMIDVQFDCSAGTDGQWEVVGYGCDKAADITAAKLACEDIVAGEIAKLKAGIERDRAEDEQFHLDAIDMRRIRREIIEELGTEIETWSDVLAAIRDLKSAVLHQAALKPTRNTQESPCQTKPM